jgi:hypothetical protein
MEPGFVIVWVALIGGSAIGAYLVHIVHKRSSKSFNRLCWISASFITFVFGAAAIGLQTSSSLANMLFWVAAYLAYAILAAALWKLKPKALRISLGILTQLVFVPGYILGTIGLFGLMLILADYLSPEQQIRKMRPGLDCQQVGWGNAMSDSGYHVNLYRYWEPLPILRLKIASATVNEANQAAGQTRATCESVAASAGYAK